MLHETDKTKSLRFAQFFNQRRFFLQPNNTLCAVYLYLALFKHGQQWRNAKRGEGSKLCHPAARDSKCEKGWTRSERSKNQQLQLLLAVFCLHFSCDQKVNDPFHLFSINILIQHIFSSQNCSVESATLS